MEGTLNGGATIKAGDTYNYLNDNYGSGISIEGTNRTVSFKMLVKGSIRLKFRPLSCNKVEIRLRKSDSVKTFMTLESSTSYVDLVVDITDIEVGDDIEAYVSTSSSNYGLRLFKMTYDI